MEIQVRRYDVSAKMDFTREGIISNRPLTEYLQYLNIQPKELESLANKKILLVGGGVSPIREWLEAIKIEAEVTNLDFFFDADERCSHKHIKEDFFKWAGPPVSSVLPASSLPDQNAVAEGSPRDYFNEIWALHSLPLYTLSKVEPVLFFAKAALMLAPGGNLRVFPVNDGTADAIFDCKEFYSTVEKGKDSHKTLMDMSKLGFSTKILKNELVSIVDQMLAAKGTASPYAWFDKKHQEKPWCNYCSRRDLDKAKLRAYLFQITAPLNKGKANSELTAYIAGKQPKL